VKVRPKSIVIGIVVTMSACLLGSALSAGQAAPAQNSPMSHEFFKNVQILRGIPVDEFMDTMGMFSASLGLDCVSCHDPRFSTDRSFLAVETPRIQKARQMILMMNAINSTNFGGTQMVSCFTCHRGQIKPDFVPSLALQYGELIEDPSAMTISSDTRPADPILDKYIRALGGGERLANLKSFVATGMYSGFNTGGAAVPIEVFAKAPDQRAQIIRVPDGDGTKVFDGRNGWAAEGWRPMPLMTFTGGNLAGARLEAILSFPAGIRAAFGRWRVSSTDIGGRRVDLLQGTNPGSLPVNFYFDDSGLLVRVVRWSKVAVGTLPTQIDYSDYREVAGVKLPFRTVLTWTDGQSTIELSQVQPNVQIEAARFATPAPYRRK